jgi:Phage portal protein, SPP1 Gp6-like
VTDLFSGTFSPPAGSQPFSDNRAAMQLPVTNQPWPPVRFNPVNYDMRVWSAWWSGDPDALMRAYYSIGGNSPLGRQYFATTGEAGLPSPRPGQYRGGLLGSVRRFFWGQPTPPGEKRTNYHVPIAGDLASASASLLFGRPPVLRPPAGIDEVGDVGDYLESLIDDGTHATFLEAAEMAAALGGVFLRVVWDTDIADHPWIDMVPADAAVPEFKYGRLVAVTFWSVIRDEGKKVVRHLEKHIPSQNAILHGVYVGNQTDLGMLVPLTEFEETAPYAQVLTEGNAITFPDAPLDASTVVYIPNMRPNRQWRDLGPQAVSLGRSDYSGLEGLMDGLDEVFSSWMRDIRLGKARLIVPSSYIDNIGRGKGGVFDPDREVFVPVNALASGDATLGAQIMPQQFNIRWQEHKNTVDSIIEMVITQAGYSGQTLGLEGDIAQTATEVVARERKSLTTRGKKINYWRPALQDIIYGLMTISATVFHEDIEPIRPDLDWAEVTLPDQQELAQTVAVMRGAEVASIEAGVAIMHPDWSGEKIADEVQKIYSEASLDLLSHAKVAITSAPGGPDIGQQVETLQAEILGTEPDRMAAMDVPSGDTGGESDDTQEGG